MCDKNCYFQGSSAPFLHQFLYQYLLPYTVCFMPLLVSALLLFVNTAFQASSLSIIRASIESQLFPFSTAAIGISFLQFANPNSMRNIYVLGLSLFLGVSIPQYFIMNTDNTGHGPVRTGAGWVRDSYLHF